MNPGIYLTQDSIKSAEELDFEPTFSSQTIKNAKVKKDKFRYKDLSPSERNKKTQNLLNKFKANVLSLASMNGSLIDSQPENAFSRTMNSSKADNRYQLSDIINNTFTKNDAFTMRAHTTKNST